MSKKGRKIRIRQGNKANIPVLDVGEPAFTVDTKELYIGSADGNINLSEFEITEASTTQKGISQLNDGISSTSITESATPNAVKKVNDKINTHQNESIVSETGVHDFRYKNGVLQIKVNGNWIDYVSGNGGSGGITLADIPNASNNERGLMTQALFAKLSGVSNGANFVQVIDELTSTSTTNAASANQVRVLKGLIDNISVGGNNEDLNNHINNETFNKHIEVVSSIPTNLSNKGILFKVDGSQADIPSMNTVDTLQSQLTQNNNNLISLDNRLTDHLAHDNSNAHVAKNIAVPQIANIPSSNLETFIRHTTGKLYPMTSSVAGVALIMTDIDPYTTSVWELVLSANPNPGGSNHYKAFNIGYINLSGIYVESQSDIGMKITYDETLRVGGGTGLGSLFFDITATFTNNADFESDIINCTPVAGMLVSVHVSGFLEGREGIGMELVLRRVI